MFGKKQTVADQLVQVLVQAGVERIYGIVGDSLNSFSDAIRRGIVQAPDSNFAGRAVQFAQ